MWLSVWRSSSSTMQEGKVSRFSPLGHYYAPPLIIVIVIIIVVIIVIEIITIIVVTAWNILIKNKYLIITWFSHTRCCEMLEEGRYSREQVKLVRKCMRLREVKLAHILDWRLARIFDRKLAGLDLSGVWGKWLLIVVSVGTPAGAMHSRMQCSIKREDVKLGATVDTSWGSWTLLYTGLHTVLVIHSYTLWCVIHWGSWILLEIQMRVSPGDATRATRLIHYTVYIVHATSWTCALPPWIYMAFTLTDLHIYCNQPSINYICC